MRIDKTLAILEVFSADGVRAYLWHRKIEKSKNRKIEKFYRLMQTLSST
jgi:hypothetical protein